MCDVASLNGELDIDICIFVICVKASKDRKKAEQS